MHPGATRLMVRSDEFRMETDEFACSFTETIPAGRVIMAGMRCVHRNNEVRAVFQSGDAEIHGLDALPIGLRL